jgi:Ca-activated chloride channel homolog
MSFLWSPLLYLLLLIPLIIVAYIWILRRRRKFAIRYSSLSLVRDAMGKQSWLRRHLPFILFLLALTSMILAFARPVATVTIPSSQATIILAMDVSLSMCSTDIPPTRLEAAKTAALAFIQKQPTTRKIGVVAFAGFAELVQPPTDDFTQLQNAINNLTPGRRTAIGSAILRSLDAIAELDKNVAPSINPNQSANSAVTPVPKGQLLPHVIVLLTDGASNAGPDPMDAAQQAVDRGIRVYTIGFGTANGSAMNCGGLFQGDFFGGGGFGPFNGGGGGGGFRRGIDEVTLTNVAKLTGGTYYSASSAGELQNAFQNLPAYFSSTRGTMEIGAFFTAFAVLMIVIAMILSFRLFMLG